MKKRLISMLMAVLMIASLLPAAAVFAAEEAAPDTHEHKYTTVSIKKDAEKKTPGVEYKVCKGMRQDRPCFYLYQNQSICSAMEPVQ